ncbi:MAG: hypothetical protein ABI723_24440 [Bacteroidia bacterium]
MKKTWRYSNNVSFSIATAQQAASVFHLSIREKITNAFTDFIVRFSLSNLNSLFSPFRFYKSDIMH